MNITITHTLSAEVIELFKSFLTPGSNEPVKESKSKKQPLTSVPAATPAPEKAEAPGAEAPESTDTNEEPVSLEIVRALVNEKAQSGESQKAKVKQLLSEFGADKLTALDAAKYTAFYTKLNLIA